MLNLKDFSEPSFEITVAIEYTYATIGFPQ